MDDGKANALTIDSIAAVSQALTDAESDTSCVAAVLAGREDRFCAGFDLNVMRSGDMGAMMNLVADGGDLVRQAFSCGVPVVAACTGHAVAAGALLLLGSDVRVGADGPYKIGLNEVAIGMTLPQWANSLARERMSKRHLQRSIANARLTDPAEAVDVGFLDRVVAPEAVLETAIAEASILASLDRAAYGRAMGEFRGELTAQMAEQIAADRARI